MSLRKDNLLPEYFENNDERDRIYQGYKSVAMSGPSFKSMLNYFMKIYKGCCGASAGINKVYYALARYIRKNIADDDYSFADEAARLQDLCLFANAYSKELDELNAQLDAAASDWLEGLSPNKLNEKQKAEDKKITAQSTLLLNRRGFIRTMNEYTDLLMNGCLEYQDVCAANNGGGSPDAFELPLFTHIPVAEDIPQGSSGAGRLMQILYNIVEQDSYLPIRMMRDCNNGKAIVRLWKKENGADRPCLFVIPKRDIYIERIAFKREKSLWPGFIETAIRILDCPQEEIPYAVLGPELENYDLSVLSGPNIRAVHEAAPGYNDMIEEYITCYYDIYSALLATKSLASKETEEQIRLTAAVWELIHALVCSLDRSFDIANPAISFLESAIEGYRKSVQDNVKADSSARKRVSICGTLETIIRLSTGASEYRKKPKLYFEKRLASRLAELMIGSAQGEGASRELEAKTAAVMNSKSFRRQAARINIHVMNTASEEYAAALLANLQSDKAFSGI